ncbi:MULTISPECIES: hypothetical protein [Nostocales]|uniref:Uncharacterized protein n=3 Tax=Nostocales TaxID=1161 RepID=A0A0C1QZG3_9CYAN|nr:hypothetical protein [Tolypothrix bouteillei]KAF3886891.1 hypothetical protein DA73_0400016405 [Tolypothrix bouteillei VB521301]
MHRFAPGPALIKNVSIVGFHYGISIGQYEYHITLEDILLKQQRVAGRKNDKNTLSIRALKSTNDVPVISVHSSYGFVIVADSYLNGETEARKNGVGVQSAGRLFIKNVSVKNYATAVQYPTPLRNPLLFAIVIFHRTLTQLLARATSSLRMLLQNSQVSILRMFGHVNLIVNVRIHNFVTWAAKSRSLL